MIIQRTINFCLSINEPDGHGINYNKDVESDMAGLMIALTTLESNLESLKSTKKLVKGQDKKSISQQISHASAAIKGIKILIINLFDGYEELKNRE